MSSVHNSLSISTSSSPDRQSPVSHKRSSQREQDIESLAQTTQACTLQLVSSKSLIDDERVISVEPESLPKIPVEILEEVFQPVQSAPIETLCIIPKLEFGASLATYLKSKWPASSYPDVTTLDLSILLSSSDYEGNIHYLQKKFPNITELKLPYYIGNIHLLSTYWPSIKSLSFKRPLECLLDSPPVENPLTDDDLNSLKRFKNLKSLSLEKRYEISKMGWSYIADLKNLECLELYIPTSLYENLSFLVPSLINFKCLKLTLYNAKDDHLLSLEKLQNLEYLSLDGYNISDQGLKRLLPHLVKLKHLDLPYSGAVLQDISSIACLTKLEHLNLRNCHSNLMSQDFLSKLTNLRSLNLSGYSYFDYQHLTQLKSLKHLRQLDLMGCSVSNNALEFIANHLSHLEHLTLCVDEISDKDLIFLSKLKKLEYVKLRIFSVSSDRALDSFTFLYHLKRCEWDLSDCFVTNNGLEFIAKHLSHLEHLILYDHKISDENLIFLSYLKKLEHLELRNCSQITDHGLASLTPLHDLKRLVLRNCHGISLNGLSILNPSLIVDVGCSSYEPVCYSVKRLRDKYGFIRNAP